jgi:hypothetical protein
MMPLSQAGEIRVKSDGLIACLQAFMRTHNLTVPALASLLQTPPETIEHWFEDGTTPPACLLALMILFDTHAKTTRDLSASFAFTAAPKNRSRQERFPDKNDDRDREEALRRVRAI